MNQQSFDENLISKNVFNRNRKISTCMEDRGERRGAYLELGDNNKMKIFVSPSNITLVSFYGKSMLIFKTLLT